VDKAFHTELLDWKNISPQSNEAGKIILTYSQFAVPTLMKALANVLRKP